MRYLISKAKNVVYLAIYCSYRLFCSFLGWFSITVDREVVGKNLNWYFHLHFTHNINEPLQNNHPKLFSGNYVVTRNREPGREWTVMTVQQPDRTYLIFNFYELWQYLDQEEWEWTVTWGSSETKCDSQQEIEVFRGSTTLTASRSLSESLSIVTHCNTLILSVTMIFMLIVILSDKLLRNLHVCRLLSKVWLCMTKPIDVVNQNVNIL